LKYFLIILLGLASFTASLSDSFTLLIFKINQDYIAKNLCVEKEVENNTCQGCCHLKKELEKKETQDKANPNHKEQKLQINFFSIPSYSCSRFSLSQKIPFYFIRHSHLMDFLSDIFHPPQ